MSFHTNRDINAFNVVSQFERRLASYSGSKHAVCVDSCTNALFLSLMYLNIKGEEVTIPCRTYPSVPNSIIHAGGRVIFKDVDWKGIYQLKPFPVIDGAKRFRANMYEKATLHCLSFHIKKILGLGRGGAILTDDIQAVEWLQKARFDGRSPIPLSEDTFTSLGWNMYMDPLTASHGLWKMMMIGDNNPDQTEEPPYPDLSTFPIYTQ